MNRQATAAISCQLMALSRQARHLSQNCACVHFIQSLPELSGAFRTQLLACCRIIAAKLFKPSVGKGNIHFVTL